MSDAQVCFALWREVTSSQLPMFPAQPPYRWIGLWVVLMTLALVMEPCLETCHCPLALTPGKPCTQTDHMLSSGALGLPPSLAEPTVWLWTAVVSAAWGTVVLGTVLLLAWS